MRVGTGKGAHGGIIGGAHGEFACAYGVGRAVVTTGSGGPGVTSGGLPGPSPLQGDRGAVAVEAAIVLPLILAVLLGVIDTALLLRAGVGLSAAVRSGARVASAEPRAETFASDAADAVARSGTGVALSDIEQLWIYRANSQGYPGPDGVSRFPSSCEDACVRFRFDQASARFVRQGGSWPASSIDACVGSAQAVGVRVVARHIPLAAGIVGPRQVAERAVMRFEPLATEGVPCRP